MKFTNVQVNRQRNLNKYKEKKRDSIVVILFINHKPVSQPIIWEEWKKINNVEYKVVCPFTITVNCSFSRKYQLEDDFYMNENKTNVIDSKYVIQQLLSDYFPLNFKNKYLGQ